MVSQKKEAENVVTLKFKVDENIQFSFIAGQYVIVYLEGRSGPEGKAYTISSIPGDNFLAITVKKIGKFSTALHELKIGATVTVEGPMGHFYPDEKSREIVFLAAGIGITPFLSIIRAYAKENPKDKKILLFYSNKTKEDTAFFDELNKLSGNNSIELFYYLTRQKVKDKHIKEFNRIDINSIKRKLKNLVGRDYFICGPIKFVFDIRRALLDSGVSELKIRTEAFY